MAVPEDVTVDPRLTQPEYQLVWPRALFAAEAAKLLNDRTTRDWDERCELLLELAFTAAYKGGPASVFREITEDVGGSFDDDPWANPAARSANIAKRPTLTAKQRFLRELLADVDNLREDGEHRRPCWRERQVGRTTRGAITRPAVVREFVRLVYELDDAGYLESRFGKDCVDDPRDDTAVMLFQRELGVDGVWPLDEQRLAEDIDLFFDVVELLHDHVSRPTTRNLHPYAGCGWHHGSFQGEPGRVVYRWRVNKILERSDLGLRIAEEGEDVGRLVTATDDARTQLVQAVTAREDSGPADQVRHALALFRERGADRNQKRSAVAAFALVLEERRHIVLAEALVDGDRGALFNIANNFHIRHQDAKQKRDYDDFYLDWIFWVYLSSIELTNRIIDATKPEARRT
ncbi:hypothetical protein [Catellatospora methionotrophica]|uniref:hypothetical protein n=1 Tax=Catellatospora methionotrophica TaxID=121620 RepID=UPI0033D15128